MKTATNRRRHFLFAGIASLFTGFFTCESRATQSDDIVHTHMRKGDPPSQPLDTMLLFERGDENNGGAITHQVMSLIHEEKGKNSFPWTLYTSLDTHHETGDACVHCARLHKNGPGWSTGLHSEVFSHDRAVALGVNIEMSNDYAGAQSQQVIGLNIQAVGGPTPMQYGIQVHDKDEHARFNTGIGLNGHGKIGLDLAGKYDVGVHTRGNNIRLGEGACIELDEKGEVKIRYREGKIEFLRGTKRLGYLDMNGEDHAI